MKRLASFAFVGWFGWALLVPCAEAAWPSNPLFNTPLCLAGGNQENPMIIGDDAGGAIVVWQDSRSGNTDIFTQRVSDGGAIQWMANGVALCTSTNMQSSPVLVSDGAGGAIVAWQDNRGGSYDIYAQRVLANGTVQWATNGVAICTAGGAQTSPVIVSDNVGGAIVAWYDGRGGAANLYAQRISSAGAVQWTVNGVAVGLASGQQLGPKIAADGASGAIVTWHDARNGNYDIYAQRVSALGAMQWTANGAAVCIAAGDQYFPVIISDGAGGAIVVWIDNRAGRPDPVYADLYAQRISSAGLSQWAANGVAVCTASNDWLGTGDQYSQALTADGAGGAIVTWVDERNHSMDIYAQRILAGGSPAWVVNGVPVCTASFNQDYPKITADGNGGAVITWQDWRNGADIYAQRVSADGLSRWLANGVPVCTAGSDSWTPAITSDRLGGAIVAWRDDRNSLYSGSDIYAQRAYCTGGLGISAVGERASGRIALLQNMPNPFNPRTTITFDLPCAGLVRLVVFDIAGRLVRTLVDENMRQGMHEISWDGSDSSGMQVASGSYSVRLEFQGGVELVRMMLVR